MPARWTTPTRLPNGGLRFPLSPTDRHVAGIAWSGGILLFFGLGTFATVQKRDIAATDWQIFAFLGGLMVVWLSLLLGIVFPLGITHADGRVGLARRIFGRQQWQEWRPAETVRRLVVRHAGANSPGALVVGSDGEPLTLAEKLAQDDLRAVASELSAALGGMTVADEETGFTGTRAEQPVLSHLHTEGDTIHLPNSAVEVRRPTTEMQRFGPEFRRLLRWYALWAIGVVGLLLFAGLRLWLILRSSVEVVINGRTTGHVFIAGHELPYGTPLPDLLSRLSAVAVPFLYAAVIDVPLLALALWLGHRLVRSVRRTAAPTPVSRIVITRLRPRPTTVTLTADTLTISHGGMESGWAWTDVEGVVAVQAHEGDESGGTTVIEWLEIRLRSGEMWKLTGADGADWEWLATRARTTAGLPEPAPLPIG